MFRKNRGKKRVGERERERSSFCFPLLAEARSRPSTTFVVKIVTHTKKNLLEELSEEFGVRLSSPFSLSLSLLHSQHHIAAVVELALLEAVPPPRGAALQRGSDSSTKTLVF